jgi:hypothetical protein
MLLEDIIQSKPEELFNYLERRVNYRFPFRKGYSDVPKRYRADGKQNYFQMPFVLLGKEEVFVAEARPDPRIKSEVTFDGKTKFFVHPNIALDYKKRDLPKLLDFRGKYLVSPLASTRSVLTKSLEYNFVIKTDLPRKIGGFARKMKKEAIEHSNKISQELDCSALPEFCGFLPESIGICHKTEGIETGNIFRELAARPTAVGKRYLIPFFSLISLDSCNKEDPLLLCQIIENSKKTDENEFDTFNRTILTPLINSFAYLVLERGILPEPHAQNLFLELNKNGAATRIVYSDFQDYGIDLSIRNKKGLDCGYSRNLVERCYLPINCEDGIVERHGFRRIKYSCTYDFVIARIIDNCSIALSKYSSCEPEKITEQTKQLFSQNFSAVAKELFPYDECFYHIITQNGPEKTFNIRRLGKKWYR